MPDRRSLIVYGLLAALVIGLGVRQLRARPGGGEEPAAAAARSPTGTTPRERTGKPVVDDGGDGRRVTVHVAGEVHRPGVYRLRSGARVDDAVSRAGGARPGADLTAVNLAAEIEDGRQVIVPPRAIAAAGTPSSAAPGAAPGAPVAKVNLNTATAEQLDELDGIGPGLAQKILAYRQEQGGFGAVRELGEVPGIGEKRMSALEAQVTV